jgi:hypothetical protein
MSEGATGKAMAWAIVDGIGVIVHGSGTPSKDEWEEWLAEYRRRSSTLEGVFIYSFGGGPTSAQRTQLLQIVDKLQHVPQTIMVTGSAMVRGIITALSWFIAPPKRAKVFAPTDLEAAFAALKLPETRRERVYRQITELAQTVMRRPGPFPARAQRDPSASSAPPGR